MAEAKPMLFLRHGAAATLAFAGIFALASVVAGLATTFTFAAVVAFACVLTFFGHLLNRGAQAAGLLNVVRVGGIRS